MPAAPRVRVVVLKYEQRQLESLLAFQGWLQAVKPEAEAAGKAGATALKDFVTKLSDSLTNGIGNLVDADLAQESARLQSLQTKQQLGIQALSIANQAPSAVLALFR